MAKLYFRYGAMGSSKSANILMVRYNYEERGQYAVLLKPRTDNRRKVIRFRTSWIFMGFRFSATGCVRTSRHICFRVRED